MGQRNKSASAFDMSPTQRYTLLPQPRKQLVRWHRARVTAAQAPFRIFIGYDRRFPEAAEVAAYSLYRHASIPLDVRYLHYGALEQHFGFQRTPDPTATTEFSFSRFATAWLCGFAGIAAFVDNDTCFLADIAELAALPMAGLAVRCCQHAYQPAAAKYGGTTPNPAYPRKNWSSLMLLNCAALRLWDIDTVETATGAFLHRFEDIPDAQVGEIDLAWNRLDVLGTPTKMLHYTSGMPLWPGCEHCPHADLWYEARRGLYTVLDGKEP